MVTHDPGAASHTDRVVFLADGRVVDEMRQPTADGVLERMKGFEKAHGPPGRVPEMLRATWKSLLARRLRLFMSAFAVMLGVAFVAGSLVFTDTLGRAFTNIMAGTVGDVVVRPTGGSADDSTQAPAPCPPPWLPTWPGSAARRGPTATSRYSDLRGRPGRQGHRRPGCPRPGPEPQRAPARHDLKALEVRSGASPSA